MASGCAKSEARLSSAAAVTAEFQWSQGQEGMGGEETRGEGWGEGVKSAGEISDGENGWREGGVRSGRH